MERDERRRDVSCSSTDCSAVREASQCSLPHGFVEVQTRGGSAHEASMNCHHRPVPPTTSTAARGWRAARNSRLATEKIDESSGTQTAHRNHNCPQTLRIIVDDTRCSVV